MSEDYDTLGCFSSLFFVVAMVAFAGWDVSSVDKESTKDATELFKRGNFDGHSYVIYEGLGTQFGMTHDPDCECQK